MGKTSIEWTDASWNPIVGCTEISPGCANCYAARLAATRLRSTQAYSGLSKISADLKIPHWIGQVRFLPERLHEPLRWKKPRKIFVCDMGDLFHESVTDLQIIEVFKIIERTAGRHTFQVLTKRAKRMRDFMHHQFAGRAFSSLAESSIVQAVKPMPWLWLGVSVESQLWADTRIPFLLETPAAVRWISAEPLLGPLEISRYLEPNHPGAFPGQIGVLDWVVCGGESGRNARPLDPYWARSLRDQCQAAGVAFFFKQWGEWAGGNAFFGPVKQTHQFNDGTRVFRVGKKKSGRLLDGRTWSEFPGDFKPWSLGKVV